MGGQVALAQSALSVRTDPAKSMKLLDVARLLGTGTLVEEAALRREIFVADQLKQYDKVEVLARQYLERFRHSVYAGNFRNRFAAAVTHMDFVKDADQFKRLDNMVENVEPPARCQIYLTVALASVVRGNGLAARLAAERASALAESGSAEQSRAALYRAAGSAGDSKTFDDAAKALADVRSDQLSPSDQSLQEMVAAVVDGVAAGTKVLPKEQRQLAWTDSAAGDPATPMMKRANDALKVADTLLAANSQ
jgi:chemotaxis protein MotC